jgi:hypothetical protein
MNVYDIIVTDCFKFQDLAGNRVIVIISCLCERLDAALSLRRRCLKDLFPETNDDDENKIAQPLASYYSTLQDYLPKKAFSYFVTFTTCCY